MSETSQSAVAQSVDFFSDSENYGPITTLPGGGEVDICIDPRVSKGMPHDERLIAAQTDGGASGKGTDSALLIKSVYGQQVGIDVGIAHAALLYPKDRLGVHPGCKYNLGVLTVLQEMSDPSAPTRMAMRNWSRVLGPRVTNGDQKEVAKAANGLISFLGEHAMLSLGYLAESPAPADDYFAYDVMGQNISRVYVAQLVPGIGLDRSKRPAGVAGEQVQGYVNGIGQSFDKLSAIRVLDPNELSLLYTAMMLRAAATRTVVTRDHSNDMHYYQVVPTKHADVVRVEPADF